jgi:hypothetical protein
MSGPGSHPNHGLAPHTHWIELVVVLGGRRLGRRAGQSAQRGAPGEPLVLGVPGQIQQAIATSTPVRAQTWFATITIREDAPQVARHARHARR